MRDIIAIDLGNTRASLARFSGPQLCYRRDLPTAQFPALLKEMLQSPFELCAVSDVNQNKALYDNWLSTMLGPRLLWIDAERAPLEIHYRPISSLGHDRIANALAAPLYAPEGAIVIDLGTACHFDVVSPKGEFLGGPIAPGLDLLHGALPKRIAHLPQTSLHELNSALTQSSAESLAAGTLLFFLAGIEHSVAKLKAELSFSPKILLTGGSAEALHRQIQHDLWLPNLTLEGIRRYAELVSAKSKESKVAIA